MIILKIILVLIAVVILAWLINLTERKSPVKSFEEFYKNTGLTVIEVTYNNKKLNLMVDTGCNNMSFIRQDCVKNKAKVNKSVAAIVGAGGNIDTSNLKSTKINFSYNENKYSELFYISTSVEKSLDKVSSQYNKRIDGIICNKFMEKNNFIINYKNYTIYEG